MVNNRERSMSEHTYPSDFPKDSPHPPVRAAWELLDAIRPGVIPPVIRFHLCRLIAGLLERERKPIAVEKFTGDYGGPGRIVATFEPEPGKVRHVVAFRIAGGFGEFYHILTDAQVRQGKSA
jgi:hypothetical protein